MKISPSLRLPLAFLVYATVAVSWLQLSEKMQWSQIWPLTWVLEVPLWVLFFGFQFAAEKVGQQWLFDWKGFKDGGDFILFPSLLGWIEVGLIYTFLFYLVSLIGIWSFRKLKASVINQKYRQKTQPDGPATPPFPTK